MKTESFNLNRCVDAIFCYFIDTSTNISKVFLQKQFLGKFWKRNIQPCHVVSCSIVEANCSAWIRIVYLQLIYDFENKTTTLVFYIKYIDIILRDFTLLW